MGFWIVLSAEHLPNSCSSFFTSGSPNAGTSIISPSCVISEDRLIQSSIYTGLAASWNEVWLIVVLVSFFHGTCGSAESGVLFGTGEWEFDWNVAPYWSASLLGKDIAPEAVVTLTVKPLRSNPSMRCFKWSCSVCLKSPQNSCPQQQSHSSRENQPRSLGRYQVAVVRYSPVKP